MPLRHKTAEIGAVQVFCRDLTLESETPSISGHSRNDEAELVAACCRQDRDAQKELYDKYSQRVYGLMCRMVGPNHADDLTQQVFLHLLKAIDRYSGRSKFGTWLFRVATNEALQFLRRNGKRKSSPVLHEPVDRNPSAIGQIEDREQLENALVRIDPDLRSVFLLREVEGLSYHELALALDIAEGTVASRLNRARKALQEILLNA